VSHWLPSAGGIEAAIYAQSECEYVQRQFIITKLSIKLKGRDFGGIRFAYPASGVGTRPYRYCNQTNATCWWLKEKSNLGKNLKPQREAKNSLGLFDYQLSNY
jgi:hypothetical protein